MSSNRTVRTAHAGFFARTKSAQFNVSILSAAISASLLSTQLAAQDLEHREEFLEEIVVTATLHRSRADTVLPVNLLAGEELREQIGATLGATLAEQVGVNSASFGPGVGAPV
ncbi:hypothetical protein N8302_01135, partial [Gammaproteobacteria bacterium]|nr:hypothetical protein [Gammaproteobacteria bacterium]